MSDTDEVRVGVIEVAISPGRDSGKFRVEVVDSPAGQAGIDVGLDAAGLLADRTHFQQMLLVSAVPARQILTSAERAVRDAGQTLFTALLGTGEVAGLYRASAALAAERGEELRIVLRIDAPELAGLPWEAMYDSGAGGYVCRHHQLVRHVSVATVAPPLQVRGPLRVLGLISAPRGLAPLDADREREQLERALTASVSQGVAEVAWAPPTWAGLQEMLLGGPWHVLHFIGHGDFDSDKDEGVLVLVAEDGRADVIEASRFADLLRQARPMPRLVVLNSCSGAATGSEDLFSGTAAALARSGVAAVAAMQYAISDPAATAFARGFYAALARGRGVDEAASAGRIAILGTSGRTLEWITPVLYLRGNDTHLFTIAPSITPSRVFQQRPAHRDSPPAPMPSLAPPSLHDQAAFSPSGRFVILTDCSAAMSGSKIQSLNFAVRELLKQLADASDGTPQFKILFQAIAMSSTARWHVDATPVHEVRWTDLRAQGGLVLGQAFSMLADEFSSPDMPTWCLPPTVMLILSTQPTDDWLSGLQQLNATDWGPHITRLAIAIGRDAPTDVLRHFLGDIEIPILDASTSSSFTSFIRWAPIRLRDDIW